MSDVQLTKMPVSRPMLSSEAPALKWRTKYTCAETLARHKLSGYQTNSDMYCLQHWECERSRCVSAELQDECVFVTQKHSPRYYRLG